MKTIKYLFGATIIVGISFSCKKADDTHQVAGLNIVNAVCDVSSGVVSFAIPPVPYYKSETFIGYESAEEFSLKSGSNSLSILSADDTTKVLFGGTLNLKNSGIYSLYLFGQAAAVDTLLMEDHIVNYTHDLAGLRFINLSSDSQPVSINIQGNPSTQAEFSNLSYKQISDFKTYDASVQYGDYTFEIHDQATGNLLTTFDWFYTGGKNNTLVISGFVDPSSSTPITVFQVNNY